MGPRDTTEREREGEREIKKIYQNKKELQNGRLSYRGVERKNKSSKWSREEINQKKGYHGTVNININRGNCECARACALPLPAEMYSLERNIRKRENRKKVTEDKDYMGKKIIFFYTRPHSVQKGHRQSEIIITTRCIGMFAVSFSHSTR